MCSMHLKSLQNHENVVVAKLIMWFMAPQITTKLRELSSSKLIMVLIAP